MLQDDTSAGSELPVLEDRHLGERAMDVETNNPHLHPLACKRTSSSPRPAVMSVAEHDALLEQLRALARHPWEVMQDRWRDGSDEAPQPGAVAPRQLR